MAKNTTTFEQFIKEIDALKKDNPTPDDIKNYAISLKKIAKKLENSQLSDDQFEFLQKQLLDLVDYLQQKSLEVKIDKKIPKPKKVKIPEIEIPVQPEQKAEYKTKPFPKEKITKPKQKETKKETKKPEPIQIKPTETKEIQVPSIEINVLDFKKQLDKRIEDLKEIKYDEIDSDIFQYFIDELNSIIEEVTFSFEDEDLKKSYKDIQLLIQNITLTKDKLSNKEYNILKNEAIKLGKYVQNILKERGAKFRGSKVKTKEETIKGKVKKYIKEKKFESIGGLLFAATDSPLLMLLGKQLDDFLQRRREKKQEEEQEKINKLNEIYKNQFSEKPKKKSKKEYKREEIKSSPIIKEKPEKELKDDDEEYKKMVSDLKRFSDESVDELELEDKYKKRTTNELKKLKKESDIEPIEEEEIELEKKTKKEEKKEIKISDFEEKTYELLKKYLPNIDLNIEKLTKSYTTTNEEQLITERDRVLKEISGSLKGKKEVKKEVTEEKDMFKGIMPYIGTIGKILAGAGAFGIGWLIGKKLDELLGITPAIQSIVDKLQGTVDDYYKKSLKRTHTQEQIEKVEQMEKLKEKLNIKRLTNQNLYEIVKNNKEILETLTENEKEIVINRAKAYEQYVKKPGEKSINEIIKKPETPEIPKTTQTKETKSEKKPEKVEPQNVNKFISNLPVINKMYDSYKEQNIKKFELEKSDNIVESTTLNDTGKQEIKEVQDISNLTFGKNVDIQNLNPVVKTNLLQMAGEYKEKTGKQLPINSAFRSREDQERLYRESPGRAARPGTSMHEKGLAVDVNTVNVNELKSTGLLKKYGFNTPVRGETWHIEPTSIRDTYIKTIKQESPTDESQIGDRKSIRKEPQTFTENNQNTNMNNVFSQNSYVINPSDFRTFIDDPNLFKEFGNQY